MKISFLINNIYGIGGTNRTVINLAEALSADHEVEIVSVFQRAATTKFEISPQVTVRPLIDLRPGKAGADRGDPGLEEPSSVVPRQEEFYAQYSDLSDRRIIDYLGKTNADVVIGTRPSLNLFVAQFTADSALRVAQEHMTHLAIPQAVRDEMARVYPRLDAVTTVTEADARSFLEHTPVPAGLPVIGIPNSVPEPVVRPSEGDRNVIVTAGRMHHVKRYDLLLQAFAQLAGDFPDWQLRIYGDGGEAAKLRTMVHELGLAGQVLLMGGFSPIESEWAKGSIAVVTSSAESFGMTLVEAMRCGLPVVSTDCPVGPREILTHGEDGLLVTNGDADAVAAGLRTVMADGELRRRMAAAALRNSARYDPAAIAARYVELFEDAAGRRAAAGGKYRKPSAKLLGRESGMSAPPSSMKTALCHATAVDAAWLRLSVDGPEEGRSRWNLRLRQQVPSGAKRLPDLPLRTQRAALDTGGTRYSANLTPEAMTSLGDGRWQVMIESAKGEVVHLKAGIRDTRGLISVRTRLLAAPTVDPVLWNLPYAQPNGKLMLRTVRRTTHAEISTVRVTDESIAVSAVMLGELDVQPGARMILTRRGNYKAELAVPADVFGGRFFDAEIPLDQVVQLRLERWEDWDWWIQPDPAFRRRVRVCHLFEDFPDVKNACAYPAVPVSTEEDPRFLITNRARPVHVRPYCSVSGAMAMNVVDR